MSAPSASPRTIFDRQRLAERRARLASGPENDPFFLLDRAGEDLLDRLSVITRQFPLAVDLATPDARLAEALAAHPAIGTMLRLAPKGRADGVAIADEEWLPLAPQSVDAVFSALALQAVNDLPGALVQIRRALKPDGLFLGALIGGNTLKELRGVLLEADAERGGAAMRVAPFIDVRDFGQLLQRAGFALPVTDVDTLTVRYDSLFHLVRDLRAMGANAPLGNSGPPLSRTTALRAAALYAERHGDADGRLRATVEIVSFSGWAPHESQQKPLRPGSARMRLADALNTSEIGAGDKAGR
ncbi:MAG: methyltransferase domain-containing protein [Hyphomicrobiaceae bacterium]|nr:methyltransferase domain-containing protein [Hyphomicrobiaceae bacterium]